MSTAREREHILNEYGAWVEGKTLGGIDTSVEAYLAEVEAEENAERLETIRTAAIEGSAATFRKVTLEVLGIKEEINDHRSR